MKKIIIYFIAIVLASCSTVEHIDRTSVFYGIDFSKYNDQGFLITPEKYNGEYDALGIVQYNLTPEANYVTVQKFTRNSDGSYSPHNQQVWFTENVDIQQALDSIYVFCKSLGANAIMNFSSRRYEVPYTNQINPVVLNGIEVGGLAIKRKAIKIKVE